MLPEKLRLATTAAVAGFCGDGTGPRYCYGWSSMGQTQCFTCGAAPVVHLQHFEKSFGEAGRHAIVG